MAQEFVRRLIVTGPEIDETLDLTEGVFVIGRQAENALRLNNPLVSRQHVQIECTAEVCQITDLGSANGTNLNGKPLEANTPSRLTSGAKIQIGPFELVFEEIAIEPAKPEPKKPAKKPAAKREPEPEPPSPPKEAAPPSIPPTPPPVDQFEFDYSKPPVGLSRTDSHYLQYLPSIYQTDFMARFLALFESILGPIEWYVDNFDLYLHPGTAPNEFLPWLAQWFSVTFNPSWTEAQQRLLLSEAHQLFARRGTKWALARILEIYTGAEPEILDLEKDEDPFTFTVKLPFTESELDRELVERIIDASKPAHTNYKLLFKQAKVGSKK